MSTSSDEPVENQIIIFKLKKYLTVFKILESRNTMRFIQDFFILKNSNLARTNNVWRVVDLKISEALSFFLYFLANSVLDLLLLH